MPKFRREDHLFARKANLLNHTLCHKCSGYCLKDGTFARLYDPANDADVPAKDRYDKTVDGVVCKMVSVPCRECRMHFGRAILRDMSGENNVTHGKPRVNDPAVGPDQNGTMKPIGRRNHAFMVEGPYCAANFNANSDTQVALINDNGRELLESLTFEEYKDFHNSLFTAGYPGLEHQCGAGLWIRYMTKYQYKGPKKLQTCGKNEGCHHRCLL